MPNLAPPPPHLVPTDTAQGEGASALAADDERRHASTGDRVEWLIDNAETYDRLLRAFRDARRCVWIAQLAFDPDCAAHPPNAGDSPRAASTVCDGHVLAEALLATAAGGPVDVRILLNSTLLLDTAAPLRRFFAAAAGVRRVRVRGVSRFPQLLHAKLVIVDGIEAFLVGSPFVNGYWDDPRHHPVDARRPPRELAGRPLHDVSLRVTGPAVHDLEAIFAELWNEAAVATADDETLRPSCAPASADGRGAIRVVRTAPRDVFRGRPEGATEILDACCAGIERARSLIYVEHQYLSARPVFAALARALARAPALELVVVLNQNPDVTAYRGWQNERLAEFGLLEHPRVGVFALWSAEPSGTRPTVMKVNQLFVHSKVVTVDDEWATVGSANLDGVSLLSYGDDFAGPLARRIFRRVRNFDVNVTVRDGAEGAPRTGSVADLRMRLWGEHLGVPSAELDARPRGGWLPVWRDRAARNVAALDAVALAGGGGSAGAPPAMNGFVLPYSVCSTPAEQLADVGVRVDPARLRLCFNPGWLEVHFSPNWVRNMFL